MKREMSGQCGDCFRARLGTVQDARLEPKRNAMSLTSQVHDAHALCLLAMCEACNAVVARALFSTIRYRWE